MGVNPENISVLGIIGGASKSRQNDDVAEWWHGPRHPEQSLDEANGYCPQGAPPRDHHNPERVQRTGTKSVSIINPYFPVYFRSFGWEKRVSPPSTQPV